MYLPKAAHYILNSLNAGGFKAYVVGGAVRNALLGRGVSDYDLCTDARPDDVKRIFPCCKIGDIGGRFGTVSVTSEDIPFEITTFRRDAAYSDHRRPDAVIFGNSLEEDLRRRDFTINAVAYHPKEGYIDPFGGVGDIKKHVIRAVGEPRDRFAEDSLRILRALRFSATLKFDIEPKTEKAVIDLREDVASLSPERIRDELSKFILAENAGTELLKYKCCWLTVVPELRCAPSCLESSLCSYDALDHAAKMVDCIKPTLHLRLAALLCNVGTSPAPKSIGRSKHTEHDAEIARGILKRLRYPNRFIREVMRLIEHRGLAADGSVASVGRALRVMGEPLIFDLIELKYADAMACHPDFSGEGLRQVSALKDAVEAALRRGDCYSIRQLAVDGNDLLSLGFPAKEIGRVLNRLLDEVIASPLKNEKKALLTRAVALAQNDRG